MKKSEYIHFMKAKGYDFYPLEKTFGEDSFHIKKDMLKAILKGVLIGLLVVIVFNIFLYLLVPLALGIFNMFLNITELYRGLDITYKFFGGFIFIFIYYKIFEAITYVTFQIIRFGTELCQ